MNIPTLAVLGAKEKNETWLVEVKRVRRGWLAGSAALFIGILMVEILSQFTANPVYLFALVAIFIVAFIIIDRCDARIGEYESNKIWANFDSQQAAYAADNRSRQDQD